MKHILLLLIAGMLMLSACEKKDDGPATGTLELVCKANFAGDPLVIGTAYDYPLNDWSLKFYLVDYLMSNVRLVDQNGEAISLADVAIVDFSPVNTDPAKAAAGIKFTFTDVPKGTYPTMIVGIGVDTAVNRTRPQDYPSGHPLSIGANRYWDAWDSFIFTKTQGLADLTGSGVFSTPFSYHTGGDALYREVSFAHNTRIEGGQTTTMTLDLDVRDLFQQADGTWWDIQAQPNAHTPDDPAMLMIMDNYEDAFSLF